MKSKATTDIEILNRKIVFLIVFLVFSFCFTGVVFALEDGLPDLIVTAIEVPASVRTLQQIEVSWTIENQGDGIAQGYWYDSLYLSVNDQWDADDTLLIDNYENRTVLPGNNYSVTRTPSIPSVSAGTYYLIMVTDWYGSSIFESNEDNNALATQITIGLPDLVVTAIDAPASASTQEQIEVSWTVQNQGDSEAIPRWGDDLCLSIDDQFDYSDIELGRTFRYEPLAPGAAYIETCIVTIPNVPPGNYYLLAVTDWANEWGQGHSHIYESNENNNLLAQPITIQVPDLVVTSIDAPVYASTGHQIQVSWTVQNQGVGNATAEWCDWSYLSADEQLDEADIALSGSRTYSPLPAGENYSVIVEPWIPNMPPGNYYLLVKADIWNWLYESNEDNNILAQPITIQAPDLVVTTIDAPASASTQEQIQVSWTVQNQGGGEAAEWYRYSGMWLPWGGDRLYFSNDNQLDAADIYLAWTGHPGPLPAGESFTTTQTVTIPKMPSGIYYLLVKVDWFDYLPESNEDNNVLAQPIAIHIPDLVVTAVDVPASVSTQQQIEVSWTVKNQGDGDAAAGWADFLYLSTDDQLDDADTYLIMSWRYEPLSVGESYTPTLMITIPQVPSGLYYLLLKADAWVCDAATLDCLYESNENNNILAQPITIQIPDLVVTAIDAPASASTQQQIEVSWTVENQGNGTAIAYWYDRLYLSTDDQLDGSDTYLGAYWRPGSLPTGENYTVTQTINIPGVPAGTYYLLVKTDYYWNNIYESNEDNNVFVRQITIWVPDLVVTAIDAPASISSQEAIQVSWTVENQGDGDATISRWYDRIYLSTDDQLDDSDTYLGWWWRTSLPAGGSHTATYGVGIPEVPSGTYYLLVETDYGNYLYESREWNNVLPELITVVEEGEEGGFTETYSDETTLVEELLSQKATLSDGIVTGDLTGTFNFTGFEIVSVNSGAFSGKGFSTGQWEAMLDGISYRGDWRGVSFLVVSKGKIYLKGSISGGEARGIAEGYLTESILGSGLYDRYQATWRLGHLADKTVSATLSFNGTLTYLEPSTYHSVEIYALQSSVDGTTFGHYTESLSTVLTHLRVVDEDNPYQGQGFSIISYTSTSGQGEGWTYDKEISPGIVEMKGVFTSPLLGIVSGMLDETKTPRTLSVTVERVDLGLLPMADLRVTTWGPGRVSPGQTVDYIIEYRNDGLKAADEVVVVFSLDPLVEYRSASTGSFYDEWSHAVSWNLFGVAPKTSDYLSIRAYVPWGLSFGIALNHSASIANIQLQSDTDNGLFGNGVGAFDWLTGGNRDEQIICGAYAHKNDLLWIHAFQGTFEIDRLDVFKAYKGEVTETNVLGDERLGTELNPREVNEVHGFSGYTTIFIRKILDGHLKVKDRIVLISAFWFPQYDPEPYNDPWRVIYELNEKCPNAKIEIWQSEKDKLPFGIWQDRQVKVPEGVQEDWLEVVRRDDCGHLQLLEEAYKGEKVGDESTDEDQIEVTTARDPNIKYGPEGNVLPGQKLDYKVEYENEGEGIAFGVYFTDTLDEDLDDSTLEIGSVISTIDGSEIAPQGTYNPSTRTITWLVGEVGPGEGGYAEISVNVKGDAVDDTEIINFGTVYFPSVPETTRTNGIVSIVRLNQPPAANAGPDQTVCAIPPATTAMVTLDGSGSYDADGDPLTYNWTWDGNTAYGVNATIELPPGTTTITVVVNDGKIDSEPDTVDVTVLIPATIDLTPDILNLQNRFMGKYVTVYVELPPGYDVRQIDISSIRLNGIVPALAKPTRIARHGRHRIPDLMVKFDAHAVKSILTPGRQVKITITGEVAGIGFQGSDTIWVIDRYPVPYH